MSLQSHHPPFPLPTIVAVPPHGLLLLRDVLICAPPLGFFFVVRSFRTTGCFLLLAGCFVFMGTLCFCFCGYDLLTGLARTPKVTRRPPRTFSLGMRSSKRIAGFDRGGFGLAATAGLLGGLGWSFIREHFARAMPAGGRGERLRRIGTGRARPPNGQGPWIARACGGGLVARVAAKDILTDFFGGRSARDVGLVLRQVRSQNEASGLVLIHPRPPAADADRDIHHRDRGTEKTSEMEAPRSALSDLGASVSWW